MLSSCRNVLCGHGDRRVAYIRALAGMAVGTAGEVILWKRWLLPVTWKRGSSLGTMIPAIATILETTVRLWRAW